MDKETTKYFTTGFVLGRLDYCNAVLVDRP